MSALSFPQKARPRRIAITFIVAMLILSVGGFIAVRLSRRSAAPIVTATSVAVVQPAVMNGTGKAGDLVITEEAMQLAEIKIAPVQTRLVSEKLAVSGTVELGGDRSAKITPRVKGKIVSLSVVVGDSVHTGQTLGLIESTELSQAQAASQQATSRLAAARNNLSRQQKLARLGQFGQPQLEQARTRSIDAEQQIYDVRRRLQTEKADLAEAENLRRGLQAQVTQAEAQVSVAKSRLNRSQALFKEELVSRQDLEQAEAESQKAQSDLEVARANFTQGETRIQSTKAQVEVAEKEYEAVKKRGEITSASLAREERVYKGQFLANKEIIEAEAAVRQMELDQRASVQSVRLLGGTPGGGSVVALTTPITGRVQERNVTVGETVDTEHAAFTVVNLDVIWAQLALAPRDLSGVRLGQSVQLTSETAPGSTFAGTVSSIGSAADETTRAVPVRVALKNGNGALRPGAFVRGRIITDLRHERVTVPTGAIQEHPGKKMSVYVAKDSGPGAFEVRHVKLGLRGEGWQEITSDLKAGERIAIRGTFYLKSEALKSSLSDGCCAAPGAD